MGVLENGWGLEVVLWFQAWRGPLIEVAVQVFHELGREQFYLILLPFIYWCVDARLGRRLVLVAMLSVWANTLLKVLWQRPRPLDVSSQVVPLVEETNYGLPSGHAQTTTAIAGVLALDARKRWFTALMVLYVLLMMISRVAAGVHFPQDVVGGALIGLIGLGLWMWLEPKIGAWLGRQRMWAQIALVTVVCALLLALHPILVPTPTAENAEAVTSAVAVLLGGGIGFVLEMRQLRFDARGAWWKRLIRLAVGLAVAMGLRFGLGAVFEDLEPALAFRVIRYALIGFWAAYGAPWVFLRAGLADRRAEP